MREKACKGEKRFTNAITRPVTNNIQLQANLADTNKHTRPRKNTNASIVRLNFIAKITTWVTFSCTTSKNDSLANIQVKFRHLFAALWKFNYYAINENLAIDCNSKFKYKNNLKTHVKRQHLNKLNSKNSSHSWILFKAHAFFFLFQQTTTTTHTHRREKPHFSSFFKLFINFSFFY